MARSDENETRAAWLDYLETCRRAVSYEAVEPYAWARLRERLRAIQRGKKR